MLVVLDLDDTLYLERDYVVSGFKDVDAWTRDTFGAEGFFEHAIALFGGGQRQRIIDDTLLHLGIDSIAATEAISRYREHRPSLRLPDDSVRFLEKAGALHALALITDGRSHAQHAKINALGIAKAFSIRIVTGDRGLHFYKPHPGAFQEVADATSATPCIYIADNPTKDFAAPLALGWLGSIRVRRRHSLHENLPTPKHCMEVKDLDEAWRALSLI
jgi:putative hydrolase of the HAD superfamily